MRSVLSLALSLLFLAVVVDVSRRFGAEERSPSRRAVHVVASAKGRLLLPAWYGDEQILGDVIQVEDANFSSRRSPPGLRVVTLSPALAPIDSRQYDLAASPEDRAAFLERCGKAEPRTVLILATRDDFRPADPVDVRRLQEAAEHLGSRLRPFDSMPASWSLVCMRIDDAWTKLAEGYSTESGVIVAFTIDSDSSRYRAFEGETMVIESDTREIQLHLELEAAAEAEDASLAFAAVGGVPRAALYLPAPSDPEVEHARAVWSDVPLGSHPVFRCSVGLQDGAWNESNGVVYSIVVDGKLVAERALGVGGRPIERAWEPWEVDLSPWADRAVRFELRVAGNGDASGDWALWAEPTIVSGTSDND